MTSTPGRGAQVILAGDAQKAARGAAAPSIEGNREAKRTLEAAGVVSDGTTAAGDSRSGAPPLDPHLTPNGAGDGGTALPYSPQLTLTPAGNVISTDASAGQNYIVPALTAATTIANPTGLQARMELKYRLTQGGGGSLIFGSLFKWAYGIVPAMTATAGAKDLLVAYFDGTDLLAVYNPDSR